MWWILRIHWLNLFLSWDNSAFAILFLLIYIWGSLWRTWVFSLYLYYVMVGRGRKSDYNLWVSWFVPNILRNEVWNLFLYNWLYYNLYQKRCSYQDYFLLCLHSSINNQLCPVSHSYSHCNQFSVLWINQISTQSSPF